MTIKVRVLSRPFSYTASPLVIRVAILSYDIAIQKNLRAGEQLRWVGRAKQGWGYRWRNRVVIVEGFAAIYLRVWLARMGSLNGIVLKLKQIAPYLADSRVLGYQIAGKTIFLDDLEDPQAFYRRLRGTRTNGRKGLTSLSWEVVSLLF